MRGLIGGDLLIALNRIPDVGEVAPSGGTVEAVLDLLEGRADDQPVATPARLGMSLTSSDGSNTGSVEISVLDALRRLSASSS